MRLQLWYHLDTDSELYSDASEPTVTIAATTAAVLRWLTGGHTGGSVVAGSVAITPGCVILLLYGS